MRWMKASTLASLPSQAGLGDISRNSSSLGGVLTRGMWICPKLGGAAQSGRGAPRSDAATTQNSLHRQSCTRSSSVDASLLAGLFRRKLPLKVTPHNARTGKANRPGPRAFVNYFWGGLASTNDFTTILFGCTPAGIMVSREYSLGSSRVDFRFWITVMSPDSEFSTSR